MAEEALEPKSLWYHYLTTVWLDKSPESATIQNIMRVLRSIRHHGALAYVSAPINSGRERYKRMLATGLDDDSPEIVEEVVKVNYDAGLCLVYDIIRRRRCPVIYPADLVPIRAAWPREYFQALWLSIIGELCTEVHMAEDWEFSGGAAEEFVQVWQLKLGLPHHPHLTFYNSRMIELGADGEAVERDRMRHIAVFNHECEPVSLGDGRAAMQRALLWLTERGFRAERLTKCLDLLDWTEERIGTKFYQ